jgi:hypothetical protein
MVVEEEVEELVDEELEMGFCESQGQSHMETGENSLGGRSMRSDSPPVAELPPISADVGFCPPSDEAPKQDWRGLFKSEKTDGFFAVF